MICCSMLARIRELITNSTLSVRFFLSGCIVMLLAAVFLGTWVTRKIEAGVLQNYGAASALYFESLVPQLPFLQTSNETLSPLERNELRRVFIDGVLNQRVVTYKVWSPDGTILASYDRSLEGQTIPISAALANAWNGEVAAELESVELHTVTDTVSIELPLVGIYVPIRNLVTGDVVSVFEFYERAEIIVSDLAQARQQTWLLVWGVFLASGGVLFGIVHTGSRLIERQQRDLRLKLAENTELKDRVAEAAVRSTTQADRVMQRIGLDLHDGVAQHLSLLALRLDGAGLTESEDAETVRTALANAMQEIRSISRGLALPDIENLGAKEIVAQAVEDHRKAFGAKVSFEADEQTATQISFPAKVGLYRLTQELLANIHKHADAEIVRVSLTQSNAHLELLVSDDGAGFDPEGQGLRSDGGQGLIGLRDRLLTLAGTLDITSKPGEGTNVLVTLPNDGMQE